MLDEGGGGHHLRCTRCEIYVKNTYCTLPYLQGEGQKRTGKKFRGGEGLGQKGMIRDITFWRWSGQLLRRKGMVWVALSGGLCDRYILQSTKLPHYDVIFTKIG